MDENNKSQENPGLRGRWGGGLTIHPPWGVDLSNQPLSARTRLPNSTSAIYSIISINSAICTLINSINLIKMDQFSQSEVSDCLFSLSPSPPSPPPPAPPALPAPVMLALPPLAIYPSKEALFEAIQKWAKDRGYAFTIQRSRTLGNGRQKVQYACDRCPVQQPSKSQPERCRVTQSRGTGCLFSILAVKASSSTDWEVKYRPEAKFNIHNHSPSQGPAAHPSHRHLSIQALAITQSLFSAGK